MDLPKNRASPARKVGGFLELRCLGITPDSRFINRNLRKSPQGLDDWKATRHRPRGIPIFAPGSRGTRFASAIKGGVAWFTLVPTALTLLPQARWMGVTPDRLHVEGGD